MIVGQHARPHEVSDVRRRRAGEEVVSALRCQGSITPGGQFFDPGDLVISNPLQHPGQPFLRIDAVELCSLDQSVGNSSGTPAPGRADKEKILPAQGQFPFILPMSGKFLACITGGMPILGWMSEFHSSVNVVMGGSLRWSVTLVWRSWRPTGFSMPPCVRH